MLYFRLKSHFSMIFPKNMGMTVSQYLMHKKDLPNFMESIAMVLVRLSSIKFGKNFQSCRCWELFPCLSGSSLRLWPYTKKVGTERLTFCSLHFKKYARNFVLIILLYLHYTLQILCKEKNSSHFCAKKMMQTKRRKILL